MGAEGSETGTAIFNDNGTYSISSSLVLSVDLNIPSSCLTQSGESCAMVDASFKALVAAGSVPDGASVSCAGSGSCVCHLTAIPTDDDESGTYVTAGDVLTTTPTTGSGTAGQLDYCVQGKTAHFIDVTTSMNMGAMGQIVIVDDQVGVQ